jgi:hypothetical protein
VLSNVLFVANELDDEVYHAVMECMTMYRAFKLKGQKLSKKDLKGDAKYKSSHISFPYARLKYLCGKLKKEELLKNLQCVLAGDCRELTLV